MKSPIDVVKGTVIDYNPRTQEMTIVCKYDDIPTMIRREYKNCLVQMVDSRPLSDKQRRAVYALLREISDYTGEGIEMTKEYMKIKFLAEDLQETADQLFSLSNASMSLISAFQRFLINLIIEWEIPTRFPLLDMVDDIDAYVYACLVNKKCCVCGRPAQCHHRQAIGAGTNRKVIIHEGLEVMPLCAEHHGEMHTIGAEAFLDKYHINHGIPADKVICRVYGLRAGKDEID